MLTKTIKTLTIAAILAGSSFTGVVADTFKIRATANSNENDEDYDENVDKPLFSAFDDQKFKERNRGQQREQALK